MKKSAIAALVLAATAVPVLAQQAMKPEDQIKMRKSTMDLIGYNFGSLERHGRRQEALRQGGSRAQRGPRLRAWSCCRSASSARARTSRARPRPSPRSGRIVPTSTRRWKRSPPRRPSCPPWPAADNGRLQETGERDRQGLQVLPRRLQGEVSAAARRIRVWDLPTRIFHWALVVLVVFSFATGNDRRRLDEVAPEERLHHPHPGALPHRLGRRRQRDRALRAFRARLRAPSRPTARATLGAPASGGRRATTRLAAGWSC